MSGIGKSITNISQNFNTFDVTDSYTRPADTTQYAERDALSNSTSAPVDLEFTVGDTNGQSIILNNAIITTTNKGTTLPLLKLWLFSVRVRATNDNSVFAITDDENDTLVAILPLLDASDGNVNACLQALNKEILITLNGSDTKLYGLLQVLNTYTPASAEVFQVRLGGYKI